MGSMMQNLDRDSILMLYQAGELSVEDQREVGMKALDVSRWRAALGTPRQGLRRMQAGGRVN